MNYLGMLCRKRDIADGVVEPQRAPQSTKGGGPIANRNESLNASTHEAPKEIHAIKDALVTNNFISAEEGEKQLTAIEKFYQGKLSYAEMRAIAG